MNKQPNTAKKMKKAPPPVEVAVPAPHPPSQSQVDQERGDWEGMAQDHHPSDAERPGSPGDPRHTGDK